MDVPWKTIVWQQFGAALDMFEIAVQACPDELWRERLWDDPADLPDYAEFWFLVFHTLFWLDLFLSGTKEGFVPPDPFTRDKRDPVTLLPETPYTKDQLQAYLDHGRRKCQATIEALTDETANRLCRFEWMELSFAEVLIYNLRHVQEHGAQLSMFLGQKLGFVGNWVPQVGRGDT
jgi:hypothetical protein